MTGTPLQERAGVLVKRDDAYTFGGQAGGKVRTCLALAQGAPGLVTASARTSPQALIVATIAHAKGIPARLHMPWAAAPTDEQRMVAAIGAEVVTHRPGYNTVIRARAAADAAERGWQHIPFGMEHPEAVAQTAAEYGRSAEAIRAFRPRRLVVPVGSGMSLAGVLCGMADSGPTVDVLGVMVGADPVRRLDRYAPADWRSFVTLVPSGLPYGVPAPQTAFWGVHLDPYYEAKAAPFVEAGDMFWVVGTRDPQPDRGMTLPLGIRRPALEVARG